MILIQIILIVFLILISINFMSSRSSSKTKAHKKMALIVFMFTAIVVVLFPDLLNDAAHFVGVGRGADLLLYGLTVIIIFQAFNTYVKDRQEERRFVKLARKVAILEAVGNNYKK